MTSSTRLSVLLFLCCALRTSFLLAEAPRQLMWEDLAPKVQASENPFSKLTKEQLTRLTEIAQTRDRRARGDTTISATDTANEQSTARKLEEAGVDVEGLLT